LHLSEECDDKNNFDFDGCSSDCKVEFNYNCVHNGILDECTSIYSPPTVESHSINTQTSSIEIVYSEFLYQTTIKNDDIEIAASGPNIPYSITWSATIYDNRLIVNYKSDPVIIGGNEEIVIMKIANVKAIMSQHQIPISSPEEYFYDLSVIESSAAAESANTGAAATLVSSMVISFGIALLTGGSIELMWSMMNTLQVLYYFGLMDVYFSPDLKQVLDFMSYSNFKIPFREKVDEFIGSILNIDLQPVNDKFDNMGFPAKNVIINSIDKLLVVSTMLLLAVISSLLY